MFNRFYAVVVAAFLGFSVFPAQAEVKVLASFSILADLAKVVGGEDASVDVLVGPDMDAHAYEPSAQDVGKIKSAALVVKNGLHFEPWLDKVLAASAYQGRVVVASSGVVPRQMEEEGLVQDDPHAWQNIANTIRYVDNIEAALVAVDPEHAASYQARAAAYKATLLKLDAETKALFAKVPEAKRKVITSHDAFGYFGAAYGVTFLAPAGLSSDDEPSAKTMAQLTSQIKHEGVTTVFLENMSNPRLVQQLAKDTGAILGGTLYADALSAASGPASSYLLMMQQNIDLLYKSVSGLK